MWDDHPTVRMFIKMIVSGNCRFPTVDCDEHMESEMKADEQKAHEIESDAIERCFLPEPMSKPEKNISQVIGSRVSMRILKKQMELEAVQEAAGKLVFVSDLASHPVSHPILQRKSGGERC